MTKHRYDLVCWLWKHGHGWDHVVTVRGAIVSVKRP